MRLKDVPQHPAYLVFHDAFDNGAMEVYGYADLATAQAKADAYNKRLDETGNDEAGFWRAYTKLPRIKVWRYSEGK